VKKIGIRVKGPDCILTSTQTCLPYASAHFFFFLQISAVVDCPYLVKYLHCFDALFKRFEEVLKADIHKEIKSNFQFYFNELKISGLVHCFADTLSSLTSNNPKGRLSAGPTRRWCSSRKVKRNIL
jgi:hypothetical protein